ncbi:MAG: hypothetical protein KDD90_00565 [Sphingomonadaceae bacterium]|jgi:hypothetical protein|nr:hypothetical protein [Sphingomonadaceae bacterium]
MGTYKVDTLPSRRDGYIAKFRALSKSCATHLRCCIEDFAEVDPEADELCGQLNKRYDVYAVAIPFCPRRWLALAIDTLGSGQRDRIVIDIITSKDRPCALAKSYAANQLTSGGYQWVQR